jgi:hypothetical protein
MAHIYIFRLEKGQVGNNGGLDDIFKCKIERKTAYNGTKMDSASRSAASGRCPTAITVTGSAKDNYALPLETFDDSAHALPGVFRCMFVYPRG